MKKAIFIFTALAFLSAIYAQEKEAVFDNDIIKVNYKKKSAARAIMFSALFPGAGQIYIDKGNYYAYLFPIIEAALIYGTIAYDKKGDDIEKDYKKYADTYYSRERQHKVETNIINESAYWDGDSSTPHQVYNTGFFILDDTPSQHFYEDIGKYNKYIFGWDDWYENYVMENGEGEITDIDWAYENSGNYVWIGNRRPDGQDITNNGEVVKPYSAHRAVYDKRRKDAEKKYDKSDYCVYGLIFNHIIASVDAARAAKKYNSEALGFNGLQLYYANLSGVMTPVLNLGVRF